MRGRKLYFPSQSFVNQQTQTTTTTHTQRNFLFFKTIKNAEQLGLHKKSKKSLKKKSDLLAIISFFFFFCPFPMSLTALDEIYGFAWFATMLDTRCTSVFLMFIYGLSGRTERERPERCCCAFRKYFYIFILVHNIIYTCHNNSSNIKM